MREQQEPCRVRGEEAPARCRHREHHRSIGNSALYLRLYDDQNDRIYQCCALAKDDMGGIGSQRQGSLLMNAVPIPCIHKNTL